MCASMVDFVPVKPMSKGVSFMSLTTQIHTSKVGVYRGSLAFGMSLTLNVIGFAD